MAAGLSRRDLMTLVGLAGAGRLLSSLPGAHILAAQAPTQVSLGAFPFPLGVASGDPLPDSVVLWTRLAPKPLEGGGMPMVNVQVGWEIAADEAFRTVVQKGVEIARPELGHSVHADVKGLQPGRDYFYRFHAAGETSQTGRTKTAPPPARPSIACGLPCADAATSKAGISPRIAASLKSRSTSSSTRAITSTRGAAMRRGWAAAAYVTTTATRSTRSSTIATGTRSTSPIAICWPRTRRHRLS